ncbi:MAG: hypothetical protein Tsb002_17910 [Wenzhouxiangellaceae bacterium]
MRKQSNAEQAPPAVRRKMSSSVSGDAAIAGAVSRQVPGWRRIEALRERRALKEALTDIWSDDPDLDEDIFFPDDESSAIYAASESGQDKDSFRDFDMDEFGDGDDD